MQNASNLRSRRLPLLAALVCLAGLALAACGGRSVKGDLAQPAVVPAGFDVTIVADKDNQFDLDGAPLTEEDLRSALRYRKEQNLPVATVLMKRGEKEKIKNEHIIGLARVAFQLNIKAYIQEKNGEISEIRAQPKADDDSAAKAQAGK